MSRPGQEPTVHEYLGQVKRLETLAKRRMGRGWPHWLTFKQAQKETHWSFDDIETVAGDSDYLEVIVAVGSRGGTMDLTPRGNCLLEWSDPYLVEIDI